VPGWQRDGVPLSQQPLQVAGSHTQVPLWHLKPGVQAAPVPQPHAPPEQVGAVVEPQLVQFVCAIPHWLSLSGETQRLGLVVLQQVPHAFVSHWQ
jgi:hypothetical protein